MKLKFEDFKKWFFVQLLISYSFIVSGLIINFFQLVLYLTVRPFNIIFYRKLSYYLSYSFYSSKQSLDLENEQLVQTKTVEYCVYIHRFGQFGTMVVGHRFESVREGRGRENVRSRERLFHSGTYFFVANTLPFQKYNRILTSLLGRITNMMWTGCWAVSIFNSST